MAQITITIPDAVMPRVTEAFAAKYGWEPSEGLTKGQFTRRCVMDFIKATTRDHEVGVAERGARATAEASVDEDIQLE